MNVAIHLQALGVNAAMISCLGQDEAGAALLTFLQQKGVDSSLIQRVPHLPTGRVKVLLDSSGNPSYKIVAPVAWDEIAFTEGAQNRVANADALIFGSLATRDAKSRETLFRLLKAARQNIFDLNLRDPYYSKREIELLLAETHLAKMNEAELFWLTGDDFSAETALFPRLEYLSVVYELEAICITQGENGAVLYENGHLHSAPAAPVEVVDTVGAGDAFLAGFIARWLKAKSRQDCLEFGCAMGAYVASRTGATPDLEGIMRSDEE